MKLRDQLYFSFGQAEQGGNASSTMPLHGHPETPFFHKDQQKGGPDKGGVQGQEGRSKYVGAKRRKQRKHVTLSAKKRQAKRRLRATSGGQSEGSSRTARNFHVVDYMGRRLHTYRTKEEADQASAGNRYTKVVNSIPGDETPEVRDMIRKRPGDTQIRTFRRSLPFPSSPYPGSPQGR